jgi:hypothetical protein
MLHCETQHAGMFAKRLNRLAKDSLGQLAGTNEVG